MIKIGALVPDEPDAYAWYRGLLPLYQLPETIITRLNGRLSWLDFASVDVVFMQNPHKADHLEVAKLAKAVAPLWVDYGDYLFDLPLYNPQYGNYINAATYDTLSGLLQLADAVTTSTETLRHELKKFTGVVTTVVNAYNEKLLSKEPAVRLNTKPRVLWRGTESHIGDLAGVAGDYNRVIAENPNVDFIFMGFVPWMIDVSAPNVAIAQSNIIEYPKVLEAINPDVLVVPLEDHIFNRCKSDIAALEVARFGTKVLVPSFAEKEWQIPGTMFYEPGKFYEELSALCQRENSRDEESWEYVINERLLSHTNVERYKLVRDLV